MAPSQSIRRSDWLALSAILVLALALRLFKLDAGLWYDEVDTLVSYTRPSFSYLLTHFPSLNHHVFFSLQAKVSIALFGENPFALRLPAALLGVASIAVLWLMAREISTRTVAHLSALLMAVAYHHVWFSQNGRGYTGLLFWGLLALLCYVRGLAAESKAGAQRNAAGLSVAAALMLYTHLSAAFFLAALGLVHLGTMARSWLGAVGLDDKRRLLWPLWGLLGGAGLALLLFLPIVPQLLESFATTAASSEGSDRKTQATAHWNSPLWMLREVASTFRGLGPLVVLAASGVMLVVGAGMWRVWQRGQRAVAATFLVHVPLTIALLQLGSMRVWPRYFFLDIGFICFFLIEGAMALGALGSKLGARVSRRTWPEARLGATLSGFGVLCAAAMLPYNYRFPKQDLLGARDFVEQNRSKDSTVVVLGLAELPFRQYYAPSWGKLESLPELLELEQSQRELWVVYGFPGVTGGRSPAVMKRLDYSFEVAKHLRGTLGDGEVFVLRPKYPKASLEVTRLGPELAVLETRELIGGNIAVYEAGGEVLVVDTNAEPMSDKVVAALRTVTDEPIRYVVNTHWHLDHAGGNAAFLERDATVIAHPNAARRLKEDLLDREESLARRLPTQLVSDELVLLLGGKEVRILHMPSAHTDGDLIVHFASDNAIHTGDLFVHGAFPFISEGSGGSIGGYIAAQRKMLSLCDTQTRIIPGHGAVASRDDLVKNVRMLEDARERVAALEREGLSLQEVIDEDPLRHLQAQWGHTWIKSPQMAKFIYTTLHRGPRP